VPPPNVPSRDNSTHRHYPISAIYPFALYRLECYGILRPLLTTHGILVLHLHRWLRTVSQQPDAPLSHVPAGIKIRPTLQLLDAFHIVNQDKLLGDELPNNTSTIIHSTANRFPFSLQDPAWILRKILALLLFKGPDPLPPVSELQVRSLADMLHCRLWIGAHGLLLRWGNSAWALDRAPSRYEDEVETTLTHFCLLPQHNPRPIPGDTVWHPSQFWLGHMSPVPLHPGLPAPLLKAVYTALTAFILIGQKDTYRTYKRLVAQALPSRKQTINGGRPPKHKILFTAYDPTKAIWPPSVHFYNLAQQFLATLEGADSPKHLTATLWKNGQSAATSNETALTLSG
jgi:hypothetical protein